MDPDAQPFCCVTCGERVPVVYHVPATPTAKAAAYGYCATCKRTEYAEQYEPALADPAQTPMRQDSPPPLNPDEDPWDYLPQEVLEAEAAAEYRAEAIMDTVCSGGHAVVLS